jgi:RNA-directed DNA polymerase
MEYFHLGSSAKPYKQLDEYISDRVRNLMRRRHRLPNGTVRFDYEEVHQDLGVVELEKLWKSHARA